VTKPADQTEDIRPRTLSVSFA